MSRWHYESDGPKGARTYYAVRDNEDAPCGVERRDFPNASAAIEFVQTENAASEETEG